jgi:hypothetical protein
LKQLSWVDRRDLWTWPKRTTGKCAPRKALDPDRQNQRPRNINATWESCGKLKVNGVRAIFLAARAGFSAARKWLPERSRLPVFRMKL